VADTYDAITTSRPYRPGLDPATAASEIRRDAGSRLCPSVVAAFDRLYTAGRFDLARGEALAASLSALRSRGYSA
jgi:response regulator RpfG family c-di-GMP phosphodiesterase